MFPWLTSVRLKLIWSGYWLALFTAMHTPKTAFGPVKIYYFDKVVHFGGYFVLAAFAIITAHRTPTILNRAWVIRWIAIFTTYAAFDEITQGLVDRTPDRWDFVTDMIGVGTAFTIARFIGVFNANTTTSSAKSAPTPSSQAPSTPAPSDAAPSEQAP